MPDIGRLNGIDQLAEMYVSTSTYAYVANNPVMRFDVDGRWFNDDGTIDTSGYTPRFTSGKQYRDSFLGANRNDGGGGGGFSANLLDRMLSLGGDWYNTGYGFESSDHISLGYDGGYRSLNTLLDGFIDIPEVVLTGDSSDWGSQIFGHFSSFMNQAWNGKLPRNEFIDGVINHKNYGLGSLGLDQAVAKTGSYVTKALDTKSTVNFTVLNKYAKPAFRTNLAGSMLKTSKVANASSVLKNVGTGLAVAGVAVSVYQVTTGQISKTEFAVDMAFTAIGFAGPAGAFISLMYFGGKALYEYETGDKLFQAP